MRSFWFPRRHTLFVIGAVAALLIAVTGCGSESKPAARPARPAATVAGTKVSARQVTADLRAEAAAGKKGKAQTDPSNPLASPKEKGAAGTYTKAATAAALTNRILYELYGQQLRSNKVKVVAADKERARQSLCADATTGKLPSGTSCPPLAAYPASYRAFQLSLRERELAFGKHLYGRVFATVKRTEPTLLREVCVNLVQVASQSVSDQVEKKLKAGASMSEASKSAAAAGTASEVRPGCVFVAAAPASLAKAKKGAVVPVQDQSSFVVAQVTEFRTATEDEFATQPPAAVASVQKLIKGEVDRSIRRAKVSVGDSYGHWDNKQLIVVAPKAPSKKGTTTSGSSTPASSSSSEAPSTTAP